jgi:hypothetical protein
MAKLKTVLASIIAAVGVWLATLMGVLLSQYAPLLLTQARLDSVFDWVRLGISAVLSLYIVSQDESSGDPDGKRKNLKRRVATAFAHGMAWSQMVGIAGLAAGAGR